MTQLSWFFGPDKLPFVLDEAGVARAEAGDPFHGIVGRGMRQLLEQEGADPQLWVRNAPRLFSSELAALAEQTETLSFGESADCVRLYLEQHCPRAEGVPSSIEAWNVKEGHTSSVWKVSILESDGETREEFALNVARDRTAGAELRASSEQMRAIFQRFPHINMAAVMDIQTVRSRRGLEVVVTRNEWVRRAHEIHAVLGESGRSRRYLLVERFLTDADKPAQIVSVYGRRFDDAECCRIAADIARFAEIASRALPRQPQLNLNDGDLVWDGCGAVVVATS